MKTSNLLFLAFLPFLLVGCVNNGQTTKPSNETSSGDSSGEEQHIHTFSDEYEYDNIYHWHPSTCGHDVVDGKEAHSFGPWVIDVEATTEHEGSKHTTCSKCGYTVTQTIDRLITTITKVTLTGSYAPQTGEQQDFSFVQVAEQNVLITPRCWEIVNENEYQEINHNVTFKANTVYSFRFSLTVKDEYYVFGSDLSCTYNGVETYGISFGERKREFRIIFPATGEDDPYLITSVHITCPRKPVVGADIDAFGSGLDDAISGLVFSSWYVKETLESEYQMVDSSLDDDVFLADHYYMFRMGVTMMPDSPYTFPEDDTTIKCYARYSFLEDYFLLTGVVHVISRSAEDKVFEIKLYDCLPDPAE